MGVPCVERVSDRGRIDLKTFLNFACVCKCQTCQTEHWSWENCSVWMSLGVLGWDLRYLESCLELRWSPQHTPLSLLLDLLLEILEKQNLSSVGCIYVDNDVNCLIDFAYRNDEPTLFLEGHTKWFEGYSVFNGNKNPFLLLSCLGRVYVGKTLVGEGWGVIADKVHFLKAQEVTLKFDGFWPYRVSLIWAIRPFDIEGRDLEGHVCVQLWTLGSLEVTWRSRLRGQ